jgi:hypothetical protein
MTIGQPWILGEAESVVPATPLNRICKELHSCFYVSRCLKGNLQKESVVDEVTEVIPISTSVAEARGWDVMNR